MASLNNKLDSETKQKKSKNNGQIFTHQKSEEVLSRLLRTIEQLNRIRIGVSEGEDCCITISNLLAINSELSVIGKTIIIDHYEHCLNCEWKERKKMLEELFKAVEYFI